MHAAAHAARCAVVAESSSAAARRRPPWRSWHLCRRRGTQHAQQQHGLQPSPKQVHAVEEVGVAAAAAQPQSGSRAAKQQRRCLCQPKPGERSTQG